MVHAVLTTPDNWFSRRVENISFVGERRVRRRVSVDVRISQEMRDAADGQGRFPLPVALMRKATLVGFDLRDEQGGALSAATSADTADMAYYVLRAAVDLAFETALAGEPGNNSGTPRNREPSKSLQDVLRAIAARERVDANKALQELPTATDPKLKADLALLLGQDGKLEPGLQKLAGDLADNFLLLAHVPVDSSRRVVKFCVEEEWETQADGRRAWAARPARWLCWAPGKYLLPTPGVGLCRSYHLEIEPPGGLVVAKATLEVAPAGKRAEKGEPNEAVYLKNNPVYPIAGYPSLAHLHMPARPRTGVVANAIVQLCPPAGGLLFAAWLASTASAILLGVTAYLVDCTAVDGIRPVCYVPDSDKGLVADAAVALLLALPVTAAVLIARPGEHVVAARLLAGVRALTLLVGACVYAAAVTLALGVPGDFLVLTWWASALLATGVASVLLVSLLRCAKLTRQLEGEARFSGWR